MAHVAADRVRSRESWHGPRRSRFLALAPVLAPLAVLIAVGALAGIGILIRNAAGYPTNDRLAHDPTVPRRPAPVYREKLQDGCYVNEDLGFAVAAPEGWKTDLGTREASRLSYDGLLFRAAKDAPAAPMISLVRRSLQPDQSKDPVAYIGAVLLANGAKATREGPEAVEINGRKGGRVRYQLASPGGTLEIEQFVLVDGQAVYTFTAVAADEAALGGRELRTVVHSFRPIS